MKPRLIIAGSGRHAKVVADLLLDADEYSLAGAVSAEPCGNLLGIPVLGGDGMLEDLRRSGVTHAFPAIGDNRIRLAVVERLIGLGFRLVNVVSPRAIVSRRASLGAGIAIMPGAVINVDATIQNGAIINTGAVVEHDCRIGNCAHLAPGCTLAGGVTVDEGAFLGAGCTVIPGRTVGAWALVGAGSVVVRDVPAGCTVAGVPARPLPAQGALP